MEEKQKIIDIIIQNEWIMFSSVNEPAGVASQTQTREQPSCQDFPDEFKLHREVKLLPWSMKTLDSYLNDLIQARKKDRNLMRYKYARMDNLIPCENESPHIDSIACQLLSWQKEFTIKYPGIMSKGRRLSGGTPGIGWASFENYMRCELESYSEKTLEHLSHDIDQMKKKGISMSEQVYTHLAQKKGYSSLDQAETKNIR